MCVLSLLFCVCLRSMRCGGGGGAIRGGTDKFPAWSDVERVIFPFLRPSVSAKKTQPQPEDLALITRWWSGGIGDGRFRSQLISIKSHPLCAQLPMLY